MNGYMTFSIREAASAKLISSVHCGSASGGSGTDATLSMCDGPSAYSLIFGMYPVYVHMYVCVYVCMYVHIFPLNVCRVHTVHMQPTSLQLARSHGHRSHRTQVTHPTPPSPHTLLSQHNFPVTLAHTTPTDIHFIAVPICTCNPLHV